MLTEHRQIDEIVVGPRHRKDFGDIDGLAASIAATSLLQPPGVTPDGRLLWGERRLRACRQLGWQDIPVIVREVDPDDMLAIEAAENFARKNFTLSEAVGIKQLLQPNLPKFGRSLPAREQIALQTGYSHETLRKAEFIVTAAEKDPARFGRLKADMDRTGFATNIYKRISNTLQADAIRAAPPPLPSGPFSVIACDPPWSDPFREDDPSHRMILGYSTLPVDEICAIPVGDIAAKDCVLLLWITNVHLLQGSHLKVLQAWGFESKVIMTWVKTNGFGMGEWLRGQTEHVIVAARGKPARQPLTNESTVLLFAPRTGQHSEKPDQFYAMVERLYPAPVDGYLEMFSRKQREGWVCWGDQVPTFNAAE